MTIAQMTQPSGRLQQALTNSAFTLLISLVSFAAWLLWQTHTDVTELKVKTFETGRQHEMIFSEQARQAGLSRDMAVSVERTLVVVDGLREKVSALRDTVDVIAGRVERLGEDVDDLKRRVERLESLHDGNATHGKGD